MIKETFNALKGIGVTDANILDVIAALEDRHEEYRKNIASIREAVQGMRDETHVTNMNVRDEMRAMKADITILKWAMAVWPTIIFGLGLAIYFK